MKLKLLVFTIALCACMGAAAQGTAFTYQGRLNEGAAPANGTYDLRFKLFLDPLANNQAGSTVLASGQAISNGLFLVTLDFGPGIFAGSNYWLQVGAKTNGAAAYQDLSPLQPLTPVPYAVYAENVVGGTLAAGTYSNAVTLNNPGNSFVGTFIGNGAGVSNVNALTLNGVSANGLWQLGGNNVAAGQFLGSTNNQPMEIWAGSARAFRVEPNTNGAPNVIGGSPANFVDPGVVGATIAGGGNISGNFYLGGGSNHVSAIFGTIAGGRVNTVAADHAFIGGGISNTVQATAYDTVIGGGVANVVAAGSAESVLVGGTYNAIQSNATYCVIAGGSGNSIGTNSYMSLIGGGWGNQVNAWYGVVAGGYGNAVDANYGVVGSGLNNSIAPGAFYSFIGGGYYNSAQASASFSTIAGGDNNSIQANASYSFIGGGVGNSIDTNAQYSVLGGGNNNTIQTNATGSFVGGGGYNSVHSNATYAVIVGGHNNVIETNSNYATMGGGFYNFCAGQSSVIGGGFYNASVGDLAVVGGGYLNRNSAQFGIITGGSANTNNGYAGTICGGQQNLNGGYAAIIGGGQVNVATNQTDTIAGGWANFAGGFVATIAGGYQNHAYGDYSALGGGQGNTVVGSEAIVGGGAFNSAASFATAVSGGYGNTASGAYSFIGCGYSNNAPGFASTVAGGFQNTATGDYSFAAGKGANAAGNHSFVWNSFPNPNYAVGTNEFYVFAENGFSIDYDVQTSAGGGDRWVYIGKGRAGGIISPTPATITTWTSAYLSDGGSWTSASDRAKKANFAAVDSRSVLAKVAQLPIATWNYTNEPAAVRHLGPMAQDFHAAFGLNGQDDKHIADIDEAGVALAAIQGLNQNEQEDRASLKSTASEIEQLRAQNRALSQRVDELEAMVSKLAGTAPVAQTFTENAQGPR